MVSSAVQPVAATGVDTGGIGIDTGVERFEFGATVWPTALCPCWGLAARVTAPMDIAACCTGRTVAEAIGDPKKGPLWPLRPGGVRELASRILLQGVVLTMPMGVARPLHGEIGMVSAAPEARAQESSAGGAACVTERQADGALYAIRVEASGTAGGGKLEVRGLVLTMPELGPVRAAQQGEIGVGALAHAQSN